VHRLDKDVSGLLVAAKSDAAHAALARGFKARRVDKRYLALVWGKPRKREGRIEAPIGRDPHNRKKMAVAESGRPALTLYRVLERFGKLAALLEVDLRTGRSHQIRVHMKHLGHPLVGDRLYGRAHPSGSQALDERVKGFGRIALHAWRLTLNHPIRGCGLCFESPMPEEIASLLEAFRRASHP
jgi:23S rRNA pseudouridine1911/1915/1917 synthase